MKKDLLICIAFHFSEDRLKYLIEVVENFNNNYKCAFDIIIDSNMDIKIDGESPKNVTFVANTDLKHPFHLTWIHRKHILENIDNYENFLYTEDDMIVPFEAYKNYLENFKLLWPKAVPGFVRIEEKDGEQFVSDIPKKQQKESIFVAGKEFNKFQFPYNYHAFWIMPQKELKESMKDDFVRVSDGREFAAMYVGWELLKPCLVELQDGQISKKCYSYHLPNNYALGSGPNGKIKPENIFL